jgi:hypothetical protein
LAAINREQLEAARRIAAVENLVVFGTMDGQKLKQAATGAPTGGMMVYFYEPG